MSETKGKEPATSAQAESRPSQMAEEVAPDAPQSGAEQQVTEEQIRKVEIELEANVQQALDSFDAWRFSRILDGKKPDDTSDPTKCTREKHKCKINGEDMSKVCHGCALYRRIVREHSVFPVGGSSGVCDVFTMHVADPLIHAFLTNGNWLKPTDALTGTWFVRSPISFFARDRNTLRPMMHTEVRRNIIRIYRTSAVLEELALEDRATEILGAMNLRYETKAGGVVYIYDELMENLAPLRAISSALSVIGIDSQRDLPIARILDGIARRVRADE